jgi:hypothetical protein
MRYRLLIVLSLLSLMIVVFPGMGSPPERYVLSPNGEISLPVGANVDLQILRLAGHISDSEGSRDIFDPVDEVPLGTIWMLNGRVLAADPSEGKLTVVPTFAGATYVAPDKVPPVNPVSVSVKIGSQGPGIPQETLMCSIRITGPENEFQIRGPDFRSEVFRQDAGTGTSSARGGVNIPNTAQMAVREGDVLAIQIAPMTAVARDLPFDSKENERLAALGGAGMTLTIKGIHGIKPGKYVWSIGDNEGKSTIVNFNIKRESGTMILWSSTDCVPHNPPPGESCKAISLDGTTTIGDYNPTTGLVNGYFQGNVVQIVVDAAGSKQTGIYAYAVGQFSAHLMTTP